MNTELLRQNADLRRDLARVERWLSVFVEAWDNTAPHDGSEAGPALIEAVLSYLHKHSEREFKGYRCCSRCGIILTDSTTSKCRGYVRIALWQSDPDHDGQRTND